MVGPFANSQDVADRWRPLTDAESGVADTLCGDSSAVIRARFPGIDAQVDAATMDLAVLVMVVAGMVKRAMLGGGDGISQETQAIGTASQSRTYANPLGNVFLTEADTVAILGYQPAGQSHQYSNTTTQVGPLPGYIYVTGPGH